MMIAYKFGVHLLNCNFAPQVCTFIDISRTDWWFPLGQRQGKQSESERGTSQVESRRGLDRRGVSLPRSVLPPNTVLQPCPTPEVCTFVDTSRIDSWLPLCLHQLPCWPEPQKRCETCNGCAVHFRQSKHQASGVENPRYDEVIQSPNIPQPYYDYEIKCDANLHVGSTAQMEAAKHNVHAANNRRPNAPGHDPTQWRGIGQPPVAIRAPGLQWHQSVGQPLAIMFGQRLRCGYQRVETNVV